MDKKKNEMQFTKINVKIITNGLTELKLITKEGLEKIRNSVQMLVVFAKTWSQAF